MSTPEDFARQVEQFTESCAFKGVSSAGAGFVFGGAFGLLMTSFEHSNFSTSSMVNGQVQQVDAPLRVQVREAFKESGRRSLAMAKSFATVGAVYATTECAIEGYRGRHDIYNSVSAGCASGAMLSFKSGPQAALVGCAGFAAFSAAIDFYMEG